MSDATVTIAGRLTDAPILRHTQNQTPVANFTVAHTPRRLNAQTQEWEDSGETLFLRVTAWARLAEHVASSLGKGDAVVVVGAVGIRSYETDAGEKRLEVVCNADVVAADLRRATAVLTRAQSSVPASPALRAV